jgi:DNA-binding MarR family transcriptional regulator
MQGKRTDLEYDKIIKYVIKKQPISITDLHIHLCVKYGLKLTNSRSHLIKRLEDKNLIKRIGKRYGNTSVFIGIT